MIDKSILTSVISKYYLNGLVEAVRWDVKDKNLNIKFTSPSKEMIGHVCYKNMPLEDATLGINNTTQLNKLLNITSGYVTLNLTKQNKIFTKLIITDKQFTVNYTLADLMIIPKSGELNGDISFDIEAKLDNESINAIVKAKVALSESDIVVIRPSLEQIEMEFGGNVEYANKVSFYISDIIRNTTSDFKIQYNSNLIKEIMSCNKDVPSGKIYISLDGIMKLEFEGKDVKSTYYLVSKE
jgi:hypothetical protein